MYTRILAILPLQILIRSAQQNCCTSNFCHCPLIYPNKPFGATVCNGGHMNEQAKTTNFEI